MASIKETATDILNRCKERTLEDGYRVTTKRLEEPFCEHLWTREFAVSGEKIVHEYFIVSFHSGSVRLEMNQVGPGREAKWVNKAEFYFQCLSVNAIAAAMESIIEND